MSFYSWFIKTEIEKMKSELEGNSILQNSIQKAVAKWKELSDSAKNRLRNGYEEFLKEQGPKLEDLDQNSKRNKEE